MDLGSPSGLCFTPSLGGVLQAPASLYQPLMTSQQWPAPTMFSKSQLAPASLKKPLPASNGQSQAGATSFNHLLQAPTILYLLAMASLSQVQQSPNSPCKSQKATTSHKWPVPAMYNKPQPPPASPKQSPPAINDQPAMTSPSQSPKRVTSS